MRERQRPTELLTPLVAAVLYALLHRTDEHVNNYMEADAATLRNMLTELEQALLESRSARTRRVQRWVS